MFSCFHNCYVSRKANYSKGGFVAQSVRGNYTRDDEQTSELYLFSGG